MSGIEKTIEGLNRYYSDFLNKHGANPFGVGYNSESAQIIRFDQLMRVIDTNKKFTIIDYGCGVGSFYDYLLKKKLDFEYYGLDRIPSMIETAIQNHKKHKNIHFIGNENDLPIADYLVAGAIFNNVLSDTNHYEWTKFIITSLDKMNALSKKGFSFNMLSKFSDPEKRRMDLYYGDPCFYFNCCISNYSNNVSLIHDYGLYDFTITVKKEN